MSITTDGFVMFAHIAAVVVGFMLAAVLHTALLMTRRAKTMAECRPWVPVVSAVEPLLPLAALAILGSGAWLIDLSGGEVAWGDGWIVVSLVTLIVIEIAGGSISPRSKRWRARLAQAPDGPVPEDVRAAGLDPVLWSVAHIATGGFLGVVFVMSARPSGLGSVLVVLIAVALSLASAVPFVRRPRTVVLPDAASPRQSALDESKRSV